MKTGPVTVYVLTAEAAYEGALETWVFGTRLEAEEQAWATEQPDDPAEQLTWLPGTDKPSYTEVVAIGRRFDWYRIRTYDVKVDLPLPQPS